MTKETNPLYAVYGTLRKDCYNHTHLDKPMVEFVGTYVTEPNFTLLDIGSFPGLLKGGTTSVVLEIYRVKSIKIEESLDHLEGYVKEDYSGNMYNKDIIDTPFGPSFIYYWNGGDSFKIIEDGDWVEYDKTKHSV